MPSDIDFNSINWNKLLAEDKTYTTMFKDRSSNP